MKKGLLVIIATTLLVACGTDRKVRKEGCSYGPRGSWSCESITESGVVKPAKQTTTKELAEEKCERYRTHKNRDYEHCMLGWAEFERKQEVDHERPDPRQR